MPNNLRKNEGFHGTYLSHLWRTYKQSPQNEKSHDEKQIILQQNYSVPQPNILIP